MQFRYTTAWKWITSTYWVLVFGLAALYYWVGFFKDFQ